jgi:UDP-glucose 4-epimerase
MSESLSSQLSIFRGSTVLITGAAGFIGKNLVRTLNELGANIILVDRKNSGNIYGVDVSIANQVDSIFKTISTTKKKSIDYVFHLADQKNASIAQENPVETLKTSFNATLNILESSRKIGTVKKVVLISSLALYGINEDGSNGVLTESHSIHNDSIYSTTKICSETLGLSYYKNFSVPVSIARLSNVYGPYQSSAAVIPYLISQMRDRQKISMGNTQSVRDFIHVQDVVDALILIASHDSATGEVFNVSTSKGTSIQRIADLLSQNLEYSGKISIDESKIRDNEKAFLVADNTKIKKMIDWSPKINIKVGLKNLCQ